MFFYASTVQDRRFGRIIKQELRTKPNVLQAVQALGRDFLSSNQYLAITTSHDWHGKVEPIAADVDGDRVAC